MGKVLLMSGYNLYISGYMKANVLKAIQGFAAAMQGKAPGMQSYHLRINSVSKPRPNRSLPETGLPPPLLSTG